MNGPAPLLQELATADVRVEDRDPQVSNLDTDVRGALRNGAKLGLSLIGTWGVAVVIRIFLPRHLGPAVFGGYQFADAFTAGLFVLASFGIETYVRKEVAARRNHATDFYGGLLVLRLVLSALLVGGAVASLAAAGKSPLVLRLVFVLAVTQFFFVQNATLAALLHAIGEVNELAVLNVASKVLWGGGTLVALLTGRGVVGVAIAMLLSEAIKMVALERIARRHLRLPIRVDLRATWAVLLGSAPYMVGGLSQALTGRINVTVMSFRASDSELGWYGAASSLTAIAMLLSPLFSWVLLPLISRARSRSDEEVMMLTQRAMRLVLTVVIPISLLLALGADTIVHILFGSAFVHAAPSLRLLAPTFVLTYVAMVSSGALIGLGRSWVVTAVLMSGLLVSPLLNWFIIPWGLGTFGPGGGGIGASVALGVSEALNAVLLTWMLGRHAFDRRTLVMLAKLAPICLVVIALDRSLLATFGITRLVADASVYVILSVLFKAGDYDALLTIARHLRPRPRRSYATIS